MLKTSKKLFYTSIILLFVFVSIQMSCKKSEKECYMKSLHATTDGMRYWYDKEDGFKNVSGVPYDKLGCKNCHAKKCERCHTEKTADGKFTKKGINQELCLGCHSRAKVTFKIDKKAGNLGVHIGMGKTCTDCHSKEDVHGDCNDYDSMREPGAVKASCGDCHQKLAENRSHKLHKDKLGCNACHVSGSTTCYNCHFDRFLETGKKKGNFIIGKKKWLMLVNYDGKVTSGTVQTLVSKGEKFIAYAPYFTHSIMENARECGDCHNNKAMKLISSGKNIQVTDFKKGKIKEWEGVIPFVPEKLQWVFLDKKGDKWVKMKNDKAPITQNVGYATPLTEKQIKSLSQSYKKK